MSELLLCRIAGVLSALVLAAAAVWCFRLNPANLSKYEPWPRNRLAGLLIGWAVLAVCVPHAAVVSPGFLQPLLWPLAVVAPVLCYFYVGLPDRTGGRRGDDFLELLSGPQGV